MTPQERVMQFLQSPVSTRAACQVLVDYTALVGLVEQVYRDGMAEGKKVRESLNPFQKPASLADERFDFLEHREGINE